MDSERTVIVVEAELPAMAAFAARHGWDAPVWRPDLFRITISGRHPADGSKALLRGDLDRYKAYAPRWRFMSIDDEDSLDTRFPAAGGLPGGGNSIFLQDKRVICAPFNRLAFAKYQGPHSDWNGPENWLSVTGHVRASTLGEMLAVIITHLNVSPGWN